jgi:hypothetical protein
MLADIHTAAGLPPIICTLLLIFTIIALVLGFVELLGFRRFTGNRFGALIVGIVLLVIYVVLC